jgi:uncharacterized protein (DUF2252 family)
MIFDETLPAPSEWDVKRLATSCVIAGQHNGYNKADAREMALRCVEGYREHIHDFAQTSVMERWYERVSSDDILGAIRSKKVAEGSGGSDRESGCAHGARG